METLSTALVLVAHIIAPPPGPLEDYNDPVCWRAEVESGPGVLCDIDGGEVEIRARPSWDAQAVDTQRCGAAVEILQKGKKARPPEGIAKYEGYQGYRSRWYQVKVAASGKTGWVFAGDLFAWEVRSPDDVRAPDAEKGYGLGCTLYLPADESNEEPGYKLFDVPFLKMKGGSRYMVPLARAERDSSDRHAFLTVPDGTDGRGTVAARVRKLRGETLVTFRLSISLPEGGTQEVFEGRLRKGDQVLELRRVEMKSEPPWSE